MPHSMPRRTFVKSMAVAGATAPLIWPSLSRAKSPNSKLNCAFVATGGRGGAHTRIIHKMGENCVAFAEVNEDNWVGVHGKDGWKSAKGYTDWRQMFEHQSKAIDTVFVACPDHSHFAPSMTAVSMGMNCYTEKPLAWSSAASAAW